MLRIGAFFDWWRTELAGMLPQKFRQRFARRGNSLRLALANGEVRVAMRQNGRLEELGRFDPSAPGANEHLAAILHGSRSAATRVEVSLPHDRLLNKEIRLPLAAEENLHEVLGFEMPRQTPFRADEVYFNYAITERRTHDQRIAVKISIAPRSTIDPLLAGFADRHLEPVTEATRIEDAGNVFRFTSDAATEKSSSGFRRVLLAFNILLLIAVVAIPFMQQQRHLSELRARLDEVRAKANAATALQERIDRQREQLRYLFARKASQPAIVELLEELSRRLPDDTWLFRLQMRDRTLHMHGTSMSASALIAELENSQFLENVQFASPVTRDDASGRERFHLSAAIQSPPASPHADRAESDGT